MVRTFFFIWWDYHNPDERNRCQIDLCDVENGGVNRLCPPAFDQLSVVEMAVCVVHVNQTSWWRVKHLPTKSAIL